MSLFIEATERTNCLCKYFLSVYEKYLWVNLSYITYLQWDCHYIFMWICSVLIFLFWVGGWLLDLQLNAKHNSDKTLFTLSYSWPKPKVPKYKPIVISSKPLFKFIWLRYQLLETFGHIRGQLKRITSTSRKISTLWNGNVCSHLCSARSAMSKHSRPIS